MFELKINEPQMPESITWNYEELKAELTEVLSDYEHRVYTEETIADAKVDKASLNRLKKTINDERIRREKEYMKPFDTFKSQVKEICSLIDGASNKISDQLDTFEKKRQQEKKDDIIKLFEEKKSGVADWITFNQVFNEKWLNKSTSMKAIKEELTAIIAQIVMDLGTIKSLPAYTFEAEEYYKRTLDLNASIAEGQRLVDIQKRKAEEEELQKQAAISKAQEQIESGVQPEATIAEDYAVDMEPEPVYTVKFQAALTRTQAIALSQFCKAHDIKLIQIKEA